MADTTKIIKREQRADGSFSMTVPTGSVVIMDGGQIFSSTATVSPTRPSALATATLSDANIAAAALAINSIATVLTNMGILTATV